MPPDPSRLLAVAGIETPLVGFYDAPDPAPFEPLKKPRKGECLFAAYEDWIAGRTLHLTADRFGCGGAGYWLFGREGRSRDEFVRFLVDGEGLKESHGLMQAWLDHRVPYRAEHPHLLFGPLRPEAWDHLRTITFFVDPDRLSLLLLGAQYHHRPGDPEPAAVPFGSGCMEIGVLLGDPDAARAVVGATDIAMRAHLPPEILAFTVTRLMFERLCAIGADSFLYKPFWRSLRRARGFPDPTGPDETGGRPGS
ncbi:MAG: DUF169 domain-containing protein [Candidatus Eisenbacteria bacterium]|nr:DUF169 domain-containing protein [Candidatus Eisenbacteria bacterium]